MSLRLSNQERLNLISNMTTMLAAGIPLLETIDSMIPELHGNQRKVMEVLREDVSQGKKISQSFARYPDSFDAVTVNLIAAAEQAGTLETTLRDLTRTIKKEIAFADTIKSSMMYPVLVLIVFVVILLIILTFVIPRVSKVFLSLRVPLPLPTKILITASNIFLAYTPFIIIGVLLFGFMNYLLYKYYRTLLFRLILSLPGLSKLAIEIDLTRFTRSFGLLLSSGIPIVEALRLSQNVVVTHRMKKVVGKAMEMINKGRPLSEGFKDSKDVIPGMMMRIVQSGEKTGTLAKAMEDLAEHFDDRVTSLLKAFTTLLEPVMLALIGFFVGGMMLAIIAPIYSIIGQISAGR